MKSRLFVLLVCLAFVFNPVVVAQEAPVAPVVTTEASVQDSKDVAVSQDGMVTLDFREADIRNVLKVLSYKSGVNIIAGPEVQGTVSIQLREVPWEQALDVILQTYGYGYEQRGNIITVTTIEMLKQRREDAQILAEQEPLITKTFLLSFSEAGQVISSIERMRTERGSINFDQRTNAIIVRDIRSNMTLIEEVIKELDAVTPQVLIDAQIVETTLTDTENLGIDWTVTGSMTGSARPWSFPFKESSNNNYLADAFPGSENFTYGALSTSSLAAVFEILNTRSNTNILSKPSLVTLDNQTARIVVGSQYPIPTYTYNEEQAALQVSGWEYMDIGVVFQVTPHVNNNDIITLDIEPQVTAIEGNVTVENTTLPQLSAKSAQTRVMVKSGETLVIAGLIKDQETDVDKKVPFLGDIPFLGNAFKKSEKTSTKTELLIFLTPRIVTPKVDR